jgi:carbon monoxide dehydrogenase subunit G
MPSAERSVVINRPVADVYNFLLDGTTGTQWRSGVLDISHVSGTGVGAVFKQGVKGPGGRRIAADYTITAADPNQRIAFKAIAGPVRPTGEYRLESSDGGTRLTFALDAQLGFLKRLMMGNAVQGSMDAEMKGLDKLKQVLESSPGAPAS